MRRSSHRPANTLCERSRDAGAEPLLLGVALERELRSGDRAARDSDAGRLPQLRVHADRGEAGHRVDLVDEEPPAVASTAGSRRAPCRRSRSRGTPRRPAAALRRPCAAGRSAGMTRARSVVEVLRLVVVELARRDDLAGDRGLRVVVAEHRALDLARVRHRRSTTILRSNCAARSIAARSPSRVFAFEMPTLEPRLAGLTNSGYAERRRHRAQRPRPRSRASRARSTTRMRTTGSPRAAKTTFIIALSMPTAEASTPAADVGHVRQLEQSLDGAVLAVRAVQHREDDVEAEAGHGRRVRRRRRRAGARDRWSSTRVFARVARPGATSRPLADGPRARVAAAPARSPRRPTSPSAADRPGPAAVLLDPDRHRLVARRDRGA